MSEFETMRLGELLKFQNGRLSPERFERGKFCVYGSNGVIGRADSSNAPGPSVVIGRVGSYCGSVYFAKEDCWVTDNAIQARGLESMDNRYLYYLTLHTGLNNWRTGSGQPLLNQSTLSAIPVQATKDELEQRAIARVLGALDDKIESNRRLQELCMSLAAVEHVYWRETVTAFIETTFGDFCDVFGGATPSTEEPSYWGGEHAWLTPTDVTALDAPYLFVTSRTLTDEGLKVASTRLHPIGTVFMTSRATIGAFAVTQIPCSTNQGFIAVQPRKDSHRWFIFHEMKSRVGLMFDMSSGSTFRELSRGTFKGMAVNVPDLEADLDRLAVVLEPLHTKAMNASRENLKLCALRDALLPELLSGRLRVKDAESMMESV